MSTEILYGSFSYSSVYETGLSSAAAIRRYPLLNKLNYDYNAIYQGRLKQPHAILTSHVLSQGPVDGSSILLQRQPLEGVILAQSTS